MVVTNPTRVMKADAARELGSKVAFNYDDLQERCDAYLESVRQQAREILQTALAEVESKRAEVIAHAQQAGYEKGQQTAQQEFQSRVQVAAESLCAQRLSSVLPALQVACDQLIHQQQLVQQQAEQSLITLSVAIAERLVRQTIRQKPQITQQLIRETLQLTGRSEQLELQLHPEDAALLTDAANTAVWQQVIGSRQVRVVPNAEISRGSCIVRSPQGMIDASWETQLQRITSELLGH